MEKQTTILNDVIFSGIGLHTGEESTIILKPAPSNTGIEFIRIDLENRVHIKAILDNVIDTVRGTNIGINGIKIFTVEHLLSAIYALKIDNMYIEINNIEPPILDGSSIEFIDGILKAGLKDLDEEKKYIKIVDPISFYDENSDIKLEIIPADNFSISFECEFDFGDIGKQTFTLDSLSNYNKEISSARTFCSFDELTYLKKNNLIKGGNTNTGLVFLNNHNTKEDIITISQKLNLDIEVKDSQNKTLNNVQLRFKDEPVRHKILDLIGDLSLIGRPILGHVKSYKSGHKTNIEFAKKIKSTYHNFKFNKQEIKKIIPHRPPFLLIDEIIGGIPGESVVAIKYITLDDYFLEGHFPGNPIMPGVLILECMAQASCFLSFNKVKDRLNKMMLLSIIDSAKFIKKVVPGDKLIIKVELLKIKLGTASISGIAKVKNEIVSKAKFKATIVDKDEQ